MYNNYDYPCGADTPNAPWNEPVIPEQKFDVTCSQTLSKDTYIYSDDYYLEEDECGRSINTSETNWQEAYTKGACTPLDLIKDCKILCEYLLDQGVTTVGPIWLKALTKECDGWVEDDFEVEPN